MSRKRKLAEARPIGRKRTFVISGISFSVGLLFASIVAFAFFKTDSSKRAIDPVPGKLANAINMATGRSATAPLQYDIGLFNLLAAEGLPGAENLNINQCLDTLNQWADHIRKETDRNFHRFRENPGEYYNSEAYFRALSLVCFIQEDYNLHYDPSQIKKLEEFTEEDIRNSKNMFIHGLLGKERMGTCSSMPVLYVTLGRRLGYPMYLASTRGHLFARWESADGKERFNIEGTAHGVSTHPDEFYKTWPQKISDEEVRACAYLKSMTPAQEVATFLCMRADILECEKRFPEAQVVLSYAHYIVPELPLFKHRFTLAMSNELEYLDKQAKVAKTQFVEAGTMIQLDATGGTRK